MNQLSAFVRPALWWLAPLAVVLVIVGWEIDWGTAVRKQLPPEVALAPKPVATELLPNYTIEGGLAARAETVNRTLFNPTRKPAPVALAEVAKPRIQRGLFTLTGTTVAGDRSLAFLKEVSGGKARTVKKGDTINGMLVAEVAPDRVRLALGDDSEELTLKVVPNPKPTPQPAPPAAAGAAPAGTAPAAQPQPPAPARPQTATAPTGSQISAQTLAERRRAARAAEAAAASANAAAGTAAAAETPAAPAAASGTDPRWQQMDERYRRRATGTGK